MTDRPTDMKTLEGRLRMARTARDDANSRRIDAERRHNLAVDQYFELARDVEGLEVDLARLDDD